MAQKDKVKELVGKGLHSYHTKALQQIDRIEKKNKEQNHKISILSNELDNDYLTKTEEGSVISLEHSKEGMVYLDELQGNTLVNYCTDGSKELTLNGDIDVEGTFVTTTEGVDNGKIDVMCEGNTLVNLGGKVNKQSNRYGLLLSSTMILKPSTLYTFIVTNLGNQSVQFYRNESVFNATTDRSKVVPANSTIVFTWETLSNLTDNGLIKSEMDGATQFTLDVVLLEGDWTNREIPQYFEGMKSVGQDDINGHKIEILSQNKNYIDLTKKTDTTNGAKMVIEDDVVTLTSIGSYSWCYNGIKLNYLKPNTKYICKGIVEGGNPQSTFRVHDFNGAISTTFKNSLVFTTPSDVSGLCLLFYISTSSPCKTGETAVFKNIQLEKSENSTDYVKRQSNKKEILINEPLRSIENINKDRIVKIGNKWFIERNLAQITLNGTENWIKWSYETPLTQLDTHLHCTIRISNIKYYSKECANVITDKFNSTRNRGTLGEYIYHDGWNDTICIKILQSKLETPDASGFKKWLQNNPIELIYELATPIYEPLEIEPTLNTYNDITHISNNSIIPCNMKIQNSGYNAIIKPSTLYTVALDTNKSGTIGMNLGGTKGTTTNNVLTLTTPATLTDDSLRLYGKGIKGSKVRLFEGDKTNWIPSHFEGMKSSFEDKFDTTDNTYKMEILSNNKNLFDINKVHSDFTVRDNTLSMTTRAYNTSIFNNTVGQNTIQDVSKLLKLKKGTYTIGCTTNNNLVVCSINSDGSFKNALATMSSDLNKRTFTLTNNSYIDIKLSNPNLDYIVSNLQIEEGNTLPNYNYVEHKSNKIQFSSIEPLRKIDDTLKDKFIFKDGKLMIERNCIEKTFDGSEVWNNDGEIKNGYLCCFVNNTLTNMKDYSKRAFKCNVLPYEGTKRYNYQQATRSGVGFLEFILKVNTNSEFRQKISELRPTVIVGLEEPTYEEIPFELQKIILEGYENGTLFFDTNIPPTSTVTYAGETPIVKSAKSNRVEVASNTTDINDNIIPYLCDMDYRIAVLELQQGQPIQADFYKLFGGVYEMLKRDILSKRLSKSEYEYRLTDYFNVGKLTEQQVRELEDLINE